MNGNNESIGITAEYLLCKYFNISCNIDEKRIIKNDKLEELIKLFPKDLLKTYEHIGYKNNSTDFLLDNEKTLSVKTTKSKIKKLCPALIGQLSSVKKFNERFNTNFTCSFNDTIFKQYIIDNIDKLFIKYIDNLFCCDYLFYIDLHGNKTDIFTKNKIIDIDKKLFTFTKTKENWNESNTLKYNMISIGEFQIHKNRNCFKFRFLFKGLLSIIIK